MSTLLTTPGLSQPGDDVAPPKMSRTANPNPTPNMSLQVALGAGSYPILEMPRINNANARSDGTSKEQDLRANFGTLIQLQVLWDNNPQQKAGISPWTANIGVERMSSSTTGGVATPSTYVRVHAGLENKFHLVGTDLTLIPGIEARRSMYRNIEHGHYLDALLVKASAEYAFSSTSQGSISAGIAPISRFGVLQPSKSGSLANTESRLLNFAALYKWSPTISSSFFIGVAEERADVNMFNLNGYASYGIPVATDARRPSATRYDLSVRQITAGAAKRF